MPANGLLYSPPHSCACYIEAKLYGFTALAPARRMKSEVGRVKEERDRLVKGPAYGAVHPSPLTLQSSSEWPTFRHDAQRSGAVNTQPESAGVCRSIAAYFARLADWLGDGAAPVEAYPGEVRRFQHVRERFVD